MRKVKEMAWYGAIYASVVSVILILVGIVGWVFVNGWDDLSIEYLTSNTEQFSIYVTTDPNDTYDIDYELVINENDETDVVITQINETGTLTDKTGSTYRLQEGDIVREVNGIDISELPAQEVRSTLKTINGEEAIELKITNPGGGVGPLILTTLFIVFWAILFAVPIGICAAIYLVEYEINPKLNKAIHFAIDALAGIPSIIFGLFGALFFSQTLGLGQSLIAGILTVCVMLLPIIIRAIEEALLSVPLSYREASFGVGASKIQTLFQIVIPAALPGIVVAVILAMGRIIGESAIFIFVVGTAPALPSFFGKGASLTVYTYRITRESPNFDMAAGVALVTIIMVIGLNIMAKIVAKKVGK